MKAKLTLGELVALAREQCGLNQSELGKAAGLSQPTISAIESGTTKQKDIKLETIIKIAGATNKPLEFFLGGSIENNTERVTIKSRSKLPLISFVMAGLRGEANDPYATGAAERWIDVMSEASDAAYCLRVRGDSMQRADGTGFPDGCIIAVEPKRKPRSGDFVVVRFANSDEATFKQYFVEGPMKLLKPLNAAFPTLQVTPDAHLAGVVFEKRIVETF